MSPEIGSALRSVHRFSRELLATLLGTGIAAFIGFSVAIVGWAFVGERLPLITLSWKIKDVVLGLIGGLATLFYIGILYSVMASISPLHRMIRTISFHHQRRYVESNPVLFMVGAVAASITEEIIFRGWIQPGIGPLLTGLLFTFVHFLPPMYRWTHLSTWFEALLFSPYSFCLCGLFAWRDGDLTAPLVAHLAINLTFSVQNIVAHQQHQQRKRKRKQVAKDAAAPVLSVPDEKISRAPQG